VGWALLALAGVALVSEGLTGGGVAGGIGFALAAGACWAGYLMFARRLGHGGTGMAGLAASLVVGALAAAPILAVSHPAAADLPAALGLGLVLGTLSTALVYAMEIAALRRASITVVGVLLALDPAVAAVIGFIALDQGLALVQLAGIALVIAAGTGVVRGAAAPVAGPGAG
jgi:inner membrane transporter RhtA